jgi:hypothetical protein
MWAWTLAGLAIAQVAYAQDQAPSELRAFPSGSDPVGAFSPAPSVSKPLPTGILRPDGVVYSTEQTLAAPDVTAPYQVTPAHGPWMVCVAYYSGPEAPGDAVRLVQWLAGTYKVPAYIFNHGAEERRKEMERRREIARRQYEYIRQLNGEVDPSIKIRVPHMHVEEQCAVLIGGYKDMETARRALDQIKKLPPPDPKQVKTQHELFIMSPDGGGQKVPVNPFMQGFVVHNPSMPLERPTTQPDTDLAFLKKLNAGEPYSLLQCPKKYTLAISQLQMPTVVQSKATSSTFMESLGFGSHAVAHQDAAALSAHNLAEVLRKIHHQEAYVLHYRFSSIVTVGSYDSADDPRLTHDIEQLNRLLTNLTTLDRMQQVRLFPRPMPMAVPR